MKTFSHKKSRWLIAIGIVVAVILMLVVVGQFTPAVTDLILKQAIDSTRYSAPAGFEAMQHNFVVKQNIPYNEHGTLLDIYYPRDAQQAMPVIMWIHGGGFIGGSKEQTRTYAMTLANGGYVVANINYDLAPGEKHPTPVVEANQALKYLSQNAGSFKGDPTRIFIGSNSSGSQIASEVAALISNEEFAKQMGIQPSLTREQLRGMLLYDGAYDMRTLRATGAPGMSLYLWSYTGVQPFESYSRIDQLSTVEHITPNYPPVFVAVGNADALKPQSMELIRVLGKNGVQVDSMLPAGTNSHLGHDYMMQLGTVPAQETLQKALSFLEQHSQP